MAATITEHDHDVSTSCHNTTQESTTATNNGNQQSLESNHIPRTSDFYHTKKLPERFDRPDLTKGYNTKHEHPMYKTSAAVYGSQAPTVHTMPTQFHGRCQKFSKALGKFGMYRNHSLNTSLEERQT